MLGVSWILNSAKKTGKISLQKGIFPASAPMGVIRQV